MVQGRNPYWQRRQLVAALRARGLSLAEIGSRLGVTRQAVYAMLRKAGRPAPRGVPCTVCRTLIPTPAARPEDRAGALCLRCLEKTPNATMGQRLRAYRLAAGLSRADVAWLAGVILMVVHDAEQGKAGAGGRTAPGRVARVLGLPEAPAVGVLRWPRVGFRPLRVLRALVEAGPGNVAAHRLAALCCVGRTKAVASLVQAGLIVGTTGPGNGYRLARPAKDIRLLEVVEAVGWSLRLELPRVPVKDGDELHGQLQAACDDAAEAGRAMLREESLADLVGEGCG
jgi:transcriptional regulator with XRE-family HTH domain